MLAAPACTWRTSTAITNLTPSKPGLRLCRPAPSTSLSRSRPVKILHVYKDYYPVLGGIENHITVLVTNSGRQSSQATLNGVSVLKAGRLATVASTPLSLSLPLALRREQPD